MPPQKELNALHYLDLDQRLREYEAYFKDGRDYRIRCDFSVRYINSPQAPAAAKRYVPDAAICLVVRNPVDQIQSHYWHLRRQNFHQSEPVRPAPALMEAIERFPHLLLEPALYGKHLARWLQLFDRENVLVLRYEDMTSDINRSLFRLCRMIGIEPIDFGPAADSVPRGEGRGGVSPKRGALGRIYPAVYAALAGGPLRLMKNTIGVRRSEAVSRVLRLRQLSEAVFFEKGYEKLAPENRMKLMRLVRDDVERLGEIAQVDVSRWLASA